LHIFSDKIVELCDGCHPMFRHRLLVNHLLLHSYSKEAPKWKIKRVGIAGEASCSSMDHHGGGNIQHRQHWSSFFSLHGGICSQAMLLLLFFMMISFWKESIGN